MVWPGYNKAANHFSQYISAELNRKFTNFLIKGPCGGGGRAKGMVSKGIVSKGIVSKGMVSKGMVSKGMVSKGMVSKTLLFLRVF